MIPPVPAPLDLSGCAREPIRTPGSIQPHGFLLTLSAAGDVLQASANLARWTGVDAEAACGQPLAQVIGAEAAARLLPALTGGTLGDRPFYLGTITAGNGLHFDALGHAWDGVVILECEAVERAEAPDFRHLYPLLGDFLLKVNESQSVESLAELAAYHVRMVTGFGRVMVYQFDRDGHGHVMAESKDDSYHSYMGQRFPASDIPSQARELYALSRIRLIQDANYVPSPLVPGDNPVTGARNDLSFAALRSVSPVHLQYMRNMGTLASMSVSLMVKGKLWGLISCHNEEACPLPFEKRTACEQLGQVLALCIESREDASELQFRLEVRRMMVAMLGNLTKGADVIDNMSSVFPELLRFARAGGVAVVAEERVLTFGDTPDVAAIRNLVSWLEAEGHGADIFHTDALSSIYPRGAALKRNASGLLAMPISRLHKHYLLWFRPEVVHTIEWAGNPHEKEVAPGTLVQLTPRTSFATWREEIHGVSLPWHVAEIELTGEFRSALLGIALERAEQMAELAEELGRANKELEAFSYSVSHDLRAPLRHIVGFSDLLLESSGSEDATMRQRFLTNIKESARLAGKLVDDLLSFSQMGRAALRPVDVDMSKLVASCIDKLAMDVKGRNIEWDLQALPRITADPTFLHLAVMNLLSNAVKFTGQRDPAIIRVWAEQDDAGTVFHFADNGAGFNMDYVHKLFGVFQRLHRMEDFQGTGIGLANVRRIVERHGGQVWADSIQGQSATFSFSIPRTLALSTQPRA
ncbi:MULTISPECIES: ATP-binding protein [unclassified Massilia]|uniref:ATP-binding protein n=1 Tax=unclassified Massilia TaxID=2609279 RepID=UPI00177F75AE|nr:MULTISPECIES: ATP-binding protein [unclassified Massilia]MBD8532560.1 GAF domain-containing protein [Massilia sp. CFBP 13647]MBD8672950.1 GAF domain-containing protein [Massilia sp. CFBP 13721]